MSPIEMEIHKIPSEESKPEVKHARQIDSLKNQCARCKSGQKDIGPRSGCEIRKKLVIDQSQVAWKHKHLFLDSKGHCKMFRERWK